MRIIIDTNVLVSAAILPHSLPYKALNLVIDDDLLLFSEETLTELVQVLDRPKFDAYITYEKRAGFLEMLGSFAEIVTVTRPIIACRDPNDDKFLSAAFHGDADYIISGDQDLLVLDPFMEIAIITHKDFVASRT